MSGQPFPGQPLPHGPPNDGLAPPSSSRKLKRKHPGGGGPNGPNGPHARQQQQQQLRGDRGPGAAGPGPMLGLPMSTGPMGWGSAFEDENTDIVLDEMDRLTPRDLCVARFRRNHELMELIFDERKIANLQPPDSPYANLSVTSLREQADSAKESMDQMKRAHEDRMRYFKENLSPAFLEKAHREAEEGADLEESAEPWSRGASKGKVVSQGFAYARAPTPDFIKAARQSRESTQAAAEESSKMNVDADADADADGDADADADADVDADAEGEGQDESATWTPEERKEKEKEFLQELHVKHGMESSTPPAPSDAPATAGQGPQAQQPGTEQAQQPSQPADAPAAPQSTSEAPASASAPESSTQDAEMVDVVQGDTGAGIAVTGGDTSEPPISSVEANPASAAAPEAPSTLPPAESASVTHPLSAEAAAASQDQAPASADKTEASETQAAPQPTEPVPGTSSSETQPPATTEAAGSTAEPSVAPATSSAADATEGAAASQPTETPVPAPAPEATAPTTAEASSAEQPAAAAMKAPTPPLNENLADNDAPLDFDAVVSASAEPSSDKAASGDAANAPQPETQGSTTASSETAGFQNP